MLGFLLTLLHLVAFVALLRMAMPESYVVLHPYVLGIDRLFNRFLGFLREGLPLSARGLSLVVMLLALAGRAALLTRLGPPAIPLGLYALFVFPVKGFVGWLGVEVLQFAYFYLMVLSANFVLRLLHIGRDLPGLAGSLLWFSARPLSRRRLWEQAVWLMLLWGLWVGGCMVGAAKVIYPMAEVPALQQALKELALPNLFDLSRLVVGARVAFLAGMGLLGVLGAIEQYLILTLLLLLVATLLRARMTLFLLDLLNLLCGALPRWRVGTLSLRPLLAILVVDLVGILLGGVWLLLFLGVQYVV